MTEIVLVWSLMVIVGGRDTSPRHMHQTTCSAHASSLNINDGTNSLLYIFPQLADRDALGGVGKICGNLH